MKNENESNIYFDKGKHALQSHLSKTGNFFGRDTICARAHVRTYIHTRSSFSFSFALLAYIDSLVSEEIRSICVCVCESVSVWVSVVFYPNYIGIININTYYTDDDDDNCIIVIIRVHYVEIALQYVYNATSAAIPIA